MRFWCLLAVTFALSAQGCAQGGGDTAAVDSGMSDMGEGPPTDAHLADTADVPAVVPDGSIDSGDAMSDVDSGSADLGTLAPDAGADLGVDAGYSCTLNSDCDNFDACDGEEICEAHACVRGTPPLCDDLNPCTTDACDGSIGCKHDFVPADSLTACSDGRACTFGDTCGDLGACVSGRAVRCRTGTSCVEPSGTCSSIIIDPAA